MENNKNEETNLRYEIYNLIKDQIICPICESIMFEPFICLKCLNIFCNACKKNLNNKCKYCKDESNPTIIKIINENKYLTKLRFKCRKGCGEEITLEDMKNHYNSDCLKNKKILFLTKEQVIKYKKKYSKEIDSLTNK